MTWLDGAQELAHRRRATHRFMGEWLEMQHGNHALALSLCVLLTSCGPPAAPTPKRVLLIVVDTLRRDHVSPYNSRVSTPNIQRIADRGLVYTNAVASFHQTTMSMAAMMTGLLPSLESGDVARSLPWNGRTFCGLARYAATRRDSCVPAAVRTVAEDFAEAGYWTAAVVANRLLFRPYGYDRGFASWIEVVEKKRPDRALARRSARDRSGRHVNQHALARRSARHRSGRHVNQHALDRRSARHRSGRHVDQHALDRRSARHRSGRHVNRQVRKLLATRPSDSFFLYVHYLDVHDYQLLDTKTYRAAAMNVDRWIGDLLDNLEQQGLLEGTSIVFVSDHGESLGERHAIPSTSSHLGNPSFEPVLQVPLIVGPAPTSRHDPHRLVRTQDIGDLLRELVGLAPRGRALLEDDELFVSEKKFQTYRNGRWKSMWSRKNGSAVLFDLEADPREANDLAPSQPEILAAHAARIGVLSDEIASPQFGSSRLSRRDRDRLRALGYLE